MMMTTEALTIREVRARPVLVPLARTHDSAGGSVGSAPLVLIDLLTEEGINGTSYLFGFAPYALGPMAELVSNMGALLVGKTVAPLEIVRTLRASFRFIGPQGLIGLVMAGIDMAAWDVLARSAELPLVRILGGTIRPLPAYASLGKSERVVADAESLAAAGFRAIKVKIGFPDLRDDVATVRAVRRALGDDVALMVDYNQTLSVSEAILRGQVLDEEGLAWIEEPTAADDPAGHARIARELRTPIQLGENWWSPREMARSLQAEASDYVMVNAMKIGGVSGWLRAAALAEAAGLPLSSHIAPEFSAHLLAATPTAHWVDYHDWLHPIVQEQAVAQDGFVIPSSTPGAGLAWDEAAVERCLLG
jgi:mandelate racemase